MLLEDRKAKPEDPKPLPPVKFHFLHELSKVTLQTRTKDQRFVTELHFRTYGDADKLDARGTEALGSLWLLARRQPSLQEWRTVRLDGRQNAEGWGPFRRRDLRDGHRGPQERGRRGGSGPAGTFPGEDAAGMGRHGQRGQDRGDPGGADLAHQGSRGPRLAPGLGVDISAGATVRHMGGHDPHAGERTGMAQGSEWKGGGRRQGTICRVFLRCPAGNGGQKGPQHAKDKVAADLQAMLSDGMRHLWPAAFKDRRTAEGLVAGDRHVQANTEGSDRYALSLPGSIRSRISPLECPVLNMTIAGDWTACGLDVGCVEAAVISGMLATHAITGDEPTLESIVGYDHPRATTKPGGSSVPSSNALRPIERPATTIGALRTMARPSGHPAQQQRSRDCGRGAHGLQGRGGADRPQRPARPAAARSGRPGRRPAQRPARPWTLRSSWCSGP